MIVKIIIMSLSAGNQFIYPIPKRSKLIFVFLSGLVLIFENK